MLDGENGLHAVDMATPHPQIRLIQGEFRQGTERPPARARGDPSNLIQFVLAEGWHTADSGRPSGGSRRALVPLLPPANPTETEDAMPASHSSRPGAGPA